MGEIISLVIFIFIIFFAIRSVCGFDQEDKLVDKYKKQFKLEERVKKEVEREQRAYKRAYKEYYGFDKPDYDP